MRIIGVFPSQEQVGGFIDSLKNYGFDRKDIIVSNVNKTNYRDSALDNVYIKTETDSLTSLATLSDLLDDQIDRDVIISVEIPKTKSTLIREVMEQNGAIKIFQD